MQLGLTCVTPIQHLKLIPLVSLMCYRSYQPSNQSTHSLITEQLMLELLSVSDTSSLQHPELHRSQRQHSFQNDGYCAQSWQLRARFAYACIHVCQSAPLILSHCLAVFAALALTGGFLLFSHFGHFCASHVHMYGRALDANIIPDCTLMVVGIHVHVSTAPYPCVLC